MEARGVTYEQGFLIQVISPYFSLPNASPQCRFLTTSESAQLSLLPSEVALSPCHITPERWQPVQL